MVNPFLTATRGIGPGIGPTPLICLTGFEIAAGNNTLEVKNQTNHQEGMNYSSRTKCEKCEKPNER